MTIRHARPNYQPHREQQSAESFLARCSLGRPGGLVGLTKGILRFRARYSLTAFKDATARNFFLHNLD